MRSCLACGVEFRPTRTAQFTCWKCVWAFSDDAKRTSECYGKAGFHDLDTARRVRRQVQKRDRSSVRKRTTVSIYRCAHCDLWHIGRSARKGAKRRDGR